jgi:putative ABC transport system permease protein
LAVGVLLLIFELLEIELPAAFSAALFISGGSMDGLRQDLLYAIRVLIKSWGVTLIAVATLALGIGANTAIFSVVNSVLLRPLPFQSSDRLLCILEKLPGFSTSIPMNAPDFNAFSERQKSFEQLGIYSNKHFDLSGTGAPERVKGTRVSASVFPLLGVAPLMGRTYTEEEDKSGHAVVVLSYGLWQRKYGSDYSIVGRAIQLDRQPYTVIGVMPKSFEFPLRGEPWADGAADLWVPISFTAEERQGWGNMYNHSVIARLKPGVTLAQAQSDASRAISEVEALYPAGLVAFFKGAHVGLVVAPYSQVVTGDVRLPLMLLLVAVGFVLLIACANVANLLLARSTARQKEIAVRAALGADRWRLARQMITESTVLGLLSGLAAILIGAWGMELILSLAPADLPRMQEVRIDWHVFLFALLLSLATAILIGITPAIEATRIDPLESLKEGGRGGGPSRGRRKLQSLLIISQTALAVMLLIGAGLLTRSFTLLLRTDPGFRPDHVVTATIALPLLAYSKADNLRNFWKDLLASSENLPGVSAAGFSTDLPLDTEERDAVTIEGNEASPNALPNVSQSWIMGDYFGAMGITLKRGRYFTPAEIVGSPDVVIASEAAARTYWPGQDPIGKRMKYGGDTWRTVIGIVGDVKDTSLQAAAGPHAYTPYLQELNSSLEKPNSDELHTLHLAVRTSVNPELVFTGIRSSVEAIDSQVALDDLKTMDALIDKSLAPQRFNLALVVLFAVLAIFLAAVGVYGVLSYSISQRTREIGVRIALGAQRGRVLRMAVGVGMKLALVGTAIGMVGGFVLTRLMASLLFGITAHDPLTFAGVGVLVAIVSFAACYIPARRAMRIDPIVALRYE